MSTAGDASAATTSRSWVGRIASWPGTPWVGLLFRLALAGIFIYAGGVKVGHPDASVRAVTAYQVLPTDLERFVGYAVPGLEIALGLLLLVGLLTRVAAGTLVALLVVFLLGIAQAWARGLSIDCGCFGGGGAIDPAKTRYLQEILRDTGFLLMAAWLVVWPRTRLSLDGLGRATDDDLPDDDLLDDDLPDDDLPDDDLPDDDLRTAAPAPAGQHDADQPERDATA